jgi:hypothetical protein
MKLRDYFQNNPGRGILATADASGNVDMAIYSGPYFTGDDDTPAFIMAERLTHQNLKSNPHACFLFMEAGGWFSGKRIYMTKIRETEDAKLVDEICEQCNQWLARSQLTAHVVFFQVDKVLPLVGGS